MHLEGIDVVGPAAGADRRSSPLFRAACAPHPRKARQCGAMLAFMASSEAAEAKRRHGMEPA